MTMEEIKMINKRELATILNISLRTLQRWMNLDRVPVPIRIGKNLRWKKSDIRSWIDEGCPIVSKQKGDK